MLALPIFYENFMIFFWKTHLSVQTCSNFSNFLRSLTNSIALYSKFFILGRFWWINFVFGKVMFFPKTAQLFRNFWEVLLILSQSTANLLPLHFLKKSCFFFKNHFFILKTRILNVSKNPIISVSFWTHLLSFSHFQNFSFFR